MTFRISSVRRGAEHFLTRRTKISFPRVPSSWRYFGVVLGVIYFSQNLPKMYHFQHTHTVDTWTTTRHSFLVTNCKVNTHSKQRCLILLMSGAVQFHKENSVRPTYVLKCTPSTSHCGKPNELGFHYTIYLHIRVSSLTRRIHHQQNECNA